MVSRDRHCSTVDMKKAQVSSSGKAFVFSWLFSLLLCGLVLRAIQVILRVHVSHPDHWLQTVEFAHLLISNIMSEVDEVSYHLRKPYLFSDLNTAAKFCEMDGS